MIDVSPCPQAPGERFDLGLADLGPTKSHKLSRLQSVEMIFLWFRKVHFQLDPKIYFSSNQGQPRRGFFPPHDSYHVRRTPCVAIDTSAEFSAERNESSADDGI